MLEYKNHPLLKLLLPLIEAGNQAHALGAFADWGGPCPPVPPEASYDLVSRCCQARMPLLAGALLAQGRADTTDLNNALEWASANGDFQFLIDLAPSCSSSMLWSAASSSLMLNEHDPSAISGLCVQLGHECLRREWQKNSADNGLVKFWKKRHRLGYEKACDAFHIPIWSAASCEPTGRAAELKAFGELASAGYANPRDAEQDRPEWMTRRSHGLGLACESLLFEGVEFEFWRQALAPDSADMAQLLEMKRVHGVLAPKIAEIAMAVENSSIHAPSQAMKDAAQFVCDSHAGSLAPFLLLWATDRKFDPKLAGIAPLLEACTLDEKNVGLFAANFTYCSYNARVAAMAAELASRGQATAGAVCALAAHFNDLMQDKVCFASIERKTFKQEIIESGQIICSIAERFELHRVTSDGTLAGLRKNSI